MIIYLENPEDSTKSLLETIDVYRRMTVQNLYANFHLNKWCWESWLVTCKKNGLRPLPDAITEVKMD